MNICILFPYDLAHQNRKGDFRKNKRAKGVSLAFTVKLRKVFHILFSFLVKFFHIAFTNQHFNEHISSFPTQIT